MTKLIKMDPERELVAAIAREMLNAGASMAEVRVRVNLECNGVEPAARRWTLLEIERERASVPGPLYSPQKTANPARARKNAKQHKDV